MFADSLLSPETIATFKLTLSMAAVGYCLILALFVLLRDYRSFVHGIFALGMIVLAAEEILAMRASAPLAPDVIIFRERLRWTVGALVPGLWLLFSLAFGRQNYRRSLPRWVWALALAFVLPLGLAVGGNGLFFRAALFVRESGSWLLPLGWLGVAFFIVILLDYVAILAALEGTLRGSTGHQRWQIKFILFGIGSLFALRIYATSQTLVYSTLDTQLAAVNSVALLIACLLVTWGLIRSQLVFPEIYLSRSVLSGSITLSLVGAYLLLTGVIGHIFGSWKPLGNLRVDAFIVFLALCALAILVRSDRVKRKIDAFVTSHFQRPRYDYRQVWTEFTRRTASLADERELAGVTARMLSETLSMLSVSLWLADEKRHKLILAGSTTFPTGSHRLALPDKLSAPLRELLERRAEPVNFEFPFGDAERHVLGEFSTVLEENQIQVCARLVACQEFLGILTLAKRVGGEAVRTEDLQLIQTIADQTASLLLNQRTAERQRKTREQEAFQNIAAFLVHDLKNVASGLSLTVQNLPKRFDNAEFREHAIKVIRESVDRMNRLCKRLSEVRRQVELNPRETDLNDLIRKALAQSAIAYRSSIVQRLQPVPTLTVDPEEITKVLTNLLGNANQAVNDSGEIVVSTAIAGDSVQISVSDNGCGMSADFIHHSLFRPFQTTKKDGMGIGLFQCKMIVEAHGGRIDVSSEEGKGTTFCVSLPLAPALATNLRS